MEEAQRLEQIRLITAIVPAVAILFCHGLVAFVLAKIAQKLGMSFKISFLLALLPIVNFILIIQMAGKPLWWFFLMLVPLVNLVFMVLAWIAIAQRRAKPGWLGLLMLVPIANFIVMFMLAAGNPTPALQPATR